MIKLMPLYTCHTFQCYKPLCRWFRWPGQSHLPLLGEEARPRTLSQSVGRLGRNRALTWGC